MANAKPASVAGRASNQPMKENRFGRFGVFCLALLLAALVMTPARAPGQPVPMKDPEAVARAYLRATQARDYVDAYRYISAEDRRIKDVNKYARQRGAFVGFALDATKKLAELSDIQLTQKARGSLALANALRFWKRWTEPSGMALSQRSTSRRARLIWSARGTSGVSSSIGPPA
jgi:hypothetical protein